MQCHNLLLLLTSAFLTARTAGTAVLRPRQGGGDTVLGTLSTWTDPGCAGEEAQDPIDLVLLYAFQCEALPEGAVAAAALDDAAAGVAYHVNLYPEPGCEGDYLTLEPAVCSDAELMPGEPPRWAAYQVVMPPINLAGSMSP